MYFKQILTPGLGCFSYVIGCPAAKKMIVVDPKRDVQDYLDISQEEGMKIVRVIDTHVHADHVSGNQELRALTRCELCMYETSPVSFPFTPLAEGDTFSVGNAKLEVIHTPGHTPDAISLLVTDMSRGNEPWMILTGDVLFVNDIGRPDLVGEAQLDTQIRNLYNSLYVKLSQYPDHLEIFPAHGMGSLCGRGMSSKPSSTLGFERRHNPMLGFANFESFALEMSQNFPTRPKSFTHIITTNLEGAPLLESCPMDKAMDPTQFEQSIDDNTVIIDTRDSAAFSGFHIPGSVNIGFEKQLANWVGMVVNPDRDILLVVNSKSDYDAMCTELHRIGYDRIHGYLYGGVSGWVYSGRPVQKLGQVSVQELHAMRTEKDLTILDVRTPAETAGGMIENATHVPLSDIMTNRFHGPKDQSYIIYCGSGYRSNIAASHLKNIGYIDVRGTAGGTVAWRQAGFSLV